MISSSRSVKCASKTDAKTIVRHGEHASASIGASMMNARMWRSSIVHANSVRGEGSALPQKWFASYGRNHGAPADSGRYTLHERCACAMRASW